MEDPSPKKGSSSSDAPSNTPKMFGQQEFCLEEREAIRQLLHQKLGKEHLATRPGAAGASFTYVESWKVIELANQIFGFNGWSSSVVDITPDYIEENTKGRFNVGVTAVVKVMLKDGTYHEDVGFGMSEHPKKGSAIENAKKEAVSDARKRALRLFGNALGNCLYDKQHLQKLKTVQKGAQGYLPENPINPMYSLSLEKGKAKTDTSASSSCNPALTDTQMPPPLSNPQPLPLKGQSSFSSRPTGQGYTAGGPVMGRPMGLSNIAAQATQQTQGSIFGTPTQATNPGTQAYADSFSDADLASEAELLEAVEMTTQGGMKRPLSQVSLTNGPGNTNGGSQGGGGVQMVNITGGNNGGGDVHNIPPEKRQKI